MNKKALYTEMRSVPCERGALTYLLTRKKVKNVNLRIKSDGRILVSANRRVSTAFIDDFVQRNQEYIFQVLERFRQRQTEYPVTPKKYVSGEDFRILGKHLTLEVLEMELGRAVSGQEAAGKEAGEKTTKVTAARTARMKEAVWVEGSVLFLLVKDKDNLKRKEKLINDWLKNLQRETFDQICREIYPLFQKYGIAYPQIKIRKMTSRWGSCQPTRGIITLNSRLIEVPRASIEYVVLHEFAHFIHPNHSKEFYTFVEKLMPDWKERKAELPVR